MKKHVTTFAAAALLGIAPVSNLYAVDLGSASMHENGEIIRVIQMGDEVNADCSFVIKTEEPDGTVRTFGVPDTTRYRSYLIDLVLDAVRNEDEVLVRTGAIVDDDANDECSNVGVAGVISMNAILVTPQVPKNP